MADAQRFALVILDGLADRPHPETGGLSPVEAAPTPNLDRLLARGRMGQVIVVGPGIAPESDAGVFALLGYDPVRDSPGRGVLEAEGAGVTLATGDVALRLNFATADSAGTIVDSRVGRSLETAEARDLARALTDADLLRDLRIRAEVRATVGHRGILWLHPDDGGRLSPEVSNSDPFYEREGGLSKARRPERPAVREVRALEDSESARRTAEAVNRFVERAPLLLAGQPANERRARSGQPLANALLLRNAGGVPERPPPSFEAKYGMDGAAITEMPVERGIARVLGLADVHVGPMGADREAALAERARVTLDALREHPFVYVHLKGPDEPGHDGRAAAKRDIVSLIDRAFFGPFVQGADWARTRLAVTADHATPAILRAHSDDPVPLLLVGAEVPADERATHAKFGESAAAHGGLGTRRSSEVLPLLLGRAE
jgi:2,3-bisphosphoglycerate-independent phosphoglycerate mutase